jgi:thiol-disulfide isomerase/thioredoxin
MKYLVALLSFLLVSTYASKPSFEEEKTPLCDDGICVIQFNAKFNAANEVTWLNDLTDCSTATVDIMADPSLPQDYKIVVVPTILVLEDGEEVARFQANIMMTMEATREEVQESIDEIIMSKF